jgi:hypothetical protein
MRRYSSLYGTEKSRNTYICPYGTEKNLTILISVR